MMRGKTGRREFVGGMSAAVWLAGRRLGAGSPPAPAPSDTVNLGLIGCGGRGRAVMRAHQKAPGARIVALCDVNSERLGQGTEASGESNLRTFRDYRRLLEQKDIDSVIIATNDHWHALTAIHACQAGKDVYLEKPAGTSIGEGRAVVAAARKYGRIVQLGTQQRSERHYREAAEIVQSGQLGEISEVKVWDYTNFYPGFGAPPDASPPREFGEEYWDLWLGPSPRVPYNPNRFLRHYWFFDYGGGWQLDWGVHHYDIVHWFMGVTAPETATAVGGFRCFEETNTEWPDTFSAICEYGPGPIARKGFLLQYSFLGCSWQKETLAAAHGKTFFGSHASLTIDRSGYTLTSEFPDMSRPPEVIRRVERELVNPTEQHARAFLDSVRDRSRPFADIETGHFSSNPGHLMNIAWRVGRKIRWQAANEHVVDDAQANELVLKKYRAPWSLEV